MEENYKKKYLEYKIKYIELKKNMEKKTQSGGAIFDDTTIIKAYTLRAYEDLIPDEQRFNVLSVMLDKNKNMNRSEERERSILIDRLYKQLVARPEYKNFPRGIKYNNSDDLLQLYKQHNEIPKYLLDLDSYTRGRTTNQIIVRSFNDKPRFLDDLRTAITKYNTQFRAFVHDPAKIISSTISAQQIEDTITREFMKGVLAERERFRNLGPIGQMELQHDARDYVGRQFFRYSNWQDSMDALESPDSPFKEVDFDGTVRLIDVRPYMK
jgi:hypothetical protein